MIPAGPTIRRVDDPDEEPPDVRLAEQRDVPRIAATLTVALADSRWTRWALPDDGRMQRLTRLHELDAGHRGVSTGTRLGHRGRHGRRRLGAAGRCSRHLPPAGRRAAALARELPYLSAHRTAAVADTAALVAAARRTARTGGWPTSACARPPAGGAWPPRCWPRRCCAATPTALPAAAAVFSWANVRFLRGFGFEVTTTTQTADDELPLWVLVRQPQR